MVGQVRALVLGLKNIRQRARFLDKGDLDPCAGIGCDALRFAEAQDLNGFPRGRPVEGVIYRNASHPIPAHGSRSPLSRKRARCLMFFKPNTKART